MRTTTTNLSIRMNVETKKEAEAFYSPLFQVYIIE